MLRRQLTWHGFVKSLYETLRTSCMVLLLIAGAVVFGKFLAITRIPFNIAAWIGGFDLPPYVIMSMIVLVYFLGGCFMDALALVMLTIPIFLPVVSSLGYDPIWFGVIIVMVTEMGVITPPGGNQCVRRLWCRRECQSTGCRWNQYSRGFCRFYWP
jgi:TRAP-type C4-dicarboxylate transport system permease large subunit